MVGKRFPNYENSWGFFCFKIIFSQNIKSEITVKFHFIYVPLKYPNS